MLPIDDQGPGGRVVDLRAPQCAVPSISADHQRSAIWEQREARLVAMLGHGRGEGPMASGRIEDLGRSQDVYPGISARHQHPSVEQSDRARPPTGGLHALDLGPGIVCRIVDLCRPLPAGACSGTAPGHQDATILESDHAERPPTCVQACAREPDVPRSAVELGRVVTGTNATRQQDATVCKEDSSMVDMDAPYGTRSLPHAVGDVRAAHSRCHR
jgi:hypothetical protein